MALAGKAMDPNAGSWTIDPVFDGSAFKFGYLVSSWLKRRGAGGADECAATGCACPALPATDMPAPWQARPLQSASRPSDCTPTHPHHQAEPNALLDGGIAACTTAPFLPSSICPCVQPPPNTRCR